MPIFQIKEYGRIRSLDDSKRFVDNDSEIVIDSKAFNSLWAYVLEYQTKNHEIEKAFKLLTKQGNRQIQVQNYVGIIETNDGTAIEILPKVFSNSGELTVDTCKRILTKLIASLYDIPHISTQHASLQTQKNLPILEVFINNYINEIEILVINGLKKDYVLTNQNIKFLKGQLLFSKDILKNLIDKSSFYTRYNEYLTDIPQNRIIKSALVKLHGITVSTKNKSRLHYLLSIFTDINSSTNLYKDLQIATKSNRMFTDYEKVLAWSELFLTNTGFTSFSGNSINLAILFPMERLFESFVAKQFKKYAIQYKVHTQDSRHSLIVDHQSRARFKLRPDIFLQSHNINQPDIILDTKWKIINSGLPAKNYNISQSDMYQLFAYGKKYSAQSRNVQLVLLFPMNQFFQKDLPSFYFEKIKDTTSLELIAMPFDLSGNYRAQIEAITEKLRSISVS